MAIEQIVSYLKENQSRYSAEQLRQALLKAGYPAQDIDNAIRATAGQDAAWGVRTKLEQVIAPPPSSLWVRIVRWVGGFVFTGLLSGLGGLIIGFLGFLYWVTGFRILPITPEIFGLHFYKFIFGTITIAAEIGIFFRLRRRFIYFARGMLTAIILQIIIAILIGAIFIAIEGSFYSGRSSYNFSGYNAPSKSRDARRVADIRQIQLALELYFDAHNRAYPNELVELEPKFIPVVPSDPASGQFYGYEKKPDGSYYLKAELEEPTNYALQNDINPGNPFYEVSDSPQQIPQPLRPSSNAKLPTVTEIPHNPNLKCTDTDGGDKPYSKGSVTGTGRCIVDGVTQDCGTVITETDVCFVNYGQPNFKPTVTEYFCGSDGRITGQSRVCANGCENGVCR